MIIQYSDDPRVLIDANTLSSGWRFVVQVQTIQNFFEPTVFDVQFYCVSAPFPPFVCAR